MSDAPADAFDSLCYGTAPFTLCLPAEPTSALTLAGNIDTTACKANNGAVSGSSLMIGTTPVCVIAATTIVTSAAVGISGNKPLVLVSKGDITIASGTTLDGRSGSSGNGPNAIPATAGRPLRVRQTPETAEEAQAARSAARVAMARRAVRRPAARRNQS